MTRRLQLTLLISALLAWSSAFAADQSVDDLIAEGNRLRRSGNDQAALEKFQKAYQKAPGPRTAAQVGLCMQALARFPEAEDLLSAALANPADPWVAKNRRALEDAMLAVKGKILRLEISGEPPGAELRIDGDLIGTFPLSGAIRVSEGSIDIEVRAEGYTTKTRTIAVNGGQYKKLVISLEKVGGPEPAQVLPAAAHATPAAEAPALLRPTPRDTSAETRPVYTRGWFWAATGAAVAAGILITLLIAADPAGPDVDARLPVGPSSEESR